MRTRQDIEAYLRRSGLPFQELAEDTWAVRAEPDQEPIVVRLEGPLVLARVGAGKVPRKGREEFYADLLRANASTLVHCSYGLDGDDVILTGTMPLENLDYNEFLSTLDDMSLAIVRDAAKGG